jgi:hypothetical protein
MTETDRLRRAFESVSICVGLQHPCGRGTRSCLGCGSKASRSRVAAHRRTSGYKDECPPDNVLHGAGGVLGAYGDPWGRLRIQKEIKGDSGML